jgi:hypothetical protein
MSVTSPASTSATSPVLPFTLANIPALKGAGPQLVTSALAALNELRSSGRLLNSSFPLSSPTQETHEMREANGLAREWVHLSSDCQRNSMTRWEVPQVLQRLAVSEFLRKTLCDAICCLPGTEESVNF